MLDLSLIQYQPFAPAAATAALNGANMYGGLLLIFLYLQLVIWPKSDRDRYQLLIMGLGNALTLAQMSAVALLITISIGTVATNWILFVQIRLQGDPEIATR